MRVEIKWNGNMQFETQTPSGHAFILDTGTDLGGQETGPRPTEVLLSAVGTCSGIDVVDILKKMRYTIDRFSIEVVGERAEDHPKRFTQMQLTYHLEGEIPVEKVRRAVQLSQEKYCSVAHSVNAEILATFILNGETYQL
ncbi:putative redox protein [Seinonella peptonophila]|uniref:Putative redox protein n=1 Tax=Seinonella peptonophila TaxID=112248 RepID=A0A1M4YY10_9BACL|nr:OsmC family protein [Seinonella peptonophila]SHF10704.1 putative redox protein [Seinonella peptonophila]